MMARLGESLCKYSYLRCDKDLDPVYLKQDLEPVYLKQDLEPVYLKQEYT
jgi:hypothetical protein